MGFFLADLHRVGAGGGQPVPEAQVLRRQTRQAVPGMHLVRDATPHVSLTPFLLLFIAILVGSPLRKTRCSFRRKIHWREILRESEERKSMMFSFK